MSLAHAAVFAAPSSTRSSSVCSSPAANALLRLVWGSATLALRDVSENFSLHNMAGNLVDEVGPDVQLVRVVGGAMHALSESGEMLPLAIGQTRTLPLASGFEVLIEGTSNDDGLLAPIATAALGVFGVTVLGSLALHLGVVSASAFSGSMGDADSEAIDRDQVLRMQRMLTANAELERERDTAIEQSGGETASGTDGLAAKGPSGKLGTVSAPSRDTRYAVQGRHDNPNPQLRAQELREAANFGLIGMLAAYAPTGGPAAEWAKPDAEGRDERNALGNMFGKTIDDANGNGGLGLDGNAEGGGGKGEGIGLRDFGGLGNNRGKDGNGPGGPGGDIGGRGYIAGGHVPKAKWPREADVRANGGHLPAEVIQRTVRQNFGRFRACYESGLRTNPLLRGRVTTRFIIDRTGAVGLTADGGSDIGDASVISCVVRSFGSLSFAAPEGGTVTVTYPLVFSAES